MAKDPDPTQSPEFQKVVQTFLRTPPKPHQAAKEKRPKKAVRKATAKAKPNR
jgi:hypothetical protein